MEPCVIAQDACKLAENIKESRENYLHSYSYSSSISSNLSGWQKAPGGVCDHMESELRVYDNQKKGKRKRELGAGLGIMSR
jgi:hypothetical protein